MEVAVRCADPVVAASVATVVGAAAGTATSCPDAAALEAAWRTVDAVVVDAESAADLAEHRRPPGPAVVVVFDDATPAPAAWTAGALLRAVAVVGLPTGEPLLLDALQTAPGRSPSGGRVVGVVGSGGGAGASTLAVLLAAAAAREGRAAGLVDADPGAGGLDLLMSAEAQPGPRWPDLLAAPVPHPLLGTPLVVDGVALVSWSRSMPPRPVPPWLLGEVVDRLRTDRDLVVLDIGRDHVQPAAGSCDAVVLVCARQVRAVAAAALLAAELDGVGDRRLVTAGTGAADLRAEDAADAVGWPLAAALPADAAVARAGAWGDLHRLSRRNRSMRAVRRLLADLAEPVPEASVSRP